MRTSTRPGGLTALAIVNFVFAGLGALGLLGGLFELFTILQVQADPEPDPLWSHLREVSVGWVVAGLLVQVLICGLLLVAGIGYLKQRGWGRWLGTGYAVLQLGWIPVEHHYRQALGEEFGLGHVISMVYPLMTLVMLHVVCRDVWRQGGWVGRMTGRSDKPDNEDRGAGAGHVGLVMRQSLWQLARGATGPLFMLCTFIVGLLLCALLFLATHGIDRMMEQSREQQTAQGREVAPAAWTVGPVVEAGLIAWLVGEVSWADFKRSLERADDRSPGRAPGTPPEANEEDDKPLLFFIHEQPELMQEHYPWTWALARDGAPGALNLCWLVLARFLLPLIVVLGAFNQIAGDAKHRGLRYVLCRTDRGSLFLGRSLAAVVFILLTLALLVVTVGVYAWLRLPDMAAGAVVWSSLQGFLALAVGAVPYVALALGISSLINSSFGALLVGELVAVVAPIALVIAAQSWAPLIGLAWLLPAGGQLYLLHHQPLPVLGMVLACGVYTVIYYQLGRRHFLRRDL